MWQRFTERARRVILLAQEEAGKMSASHVGTEHLLLGLARMDDGAASGVLRRMNIEMDVVRAAVLSATEPTGERTVPEPKLTPQAKHVLDLAAKEARSLRHHYIGTEHLLLALLREKKGTAAQVLAQLGLSWPSVREQVLLYLGSEREGSDWEAVHDAGLVQILDWMLQDDNDARRILVECGLDVEAARQKAKQFLENET